MTKYQRERKRQQLRAWIRKLEEINLTAAIMQTKAELKEARKQLKAIKRKGTK